MEEHVRAGTGLHGLGREMTAERARPRTAAKEAQQVAGHGGEPGAALQFANLAHPTR